MNKNSIVKNTPSDTKQVKTFFVIIDNEGCVFYFKDKFSAIEYFNKNDLDSDSTYLFEAVKEFDFNKLTSITDITKDINFEN